MRRRFVIVFAVVLAAAVVTSGCGRGEDRPGQVTSDSRTATTTTP